MRTILLLIFALFTFSVSAYAGMDGVEDRAAAVRSQVHGNNNYQAHLARELASIAEMEIGQHDLNAGRAFVELAEKHAAKAGGAK